MFENNMIPYIMISTENPLGKHLQGKLLHKWAANRTDVTEFEFIPVISPENFEKATNIIALNKFKDGDYVCDDKEIIYVLVYYKITRDDTENN